MTLNASLGVSVRSRSISAYDRLDAAFYSSASVLATEQIALLEASGTAVRAIGSIGSATMPPRTALARAASREESLPYLRPYDVFDYLPTAADRISIPRNVGIEAFRIQPGMILQTRSGRNLGPCTLADEELAKFALSDDMVRIEIDDEVERNIVFAFLKTKLGQRLIRRGRSGSVIDHLTVPDVEAVPVPVFPDPVAAKASSLIQEAVLLRRGGRTLLSGLINGAHTDASSEDSSWTWWTNRARNCGDRLDAGHNHPSVLSARAAALRTGGVALGELAEAVLPLRYKRYYVEAGYGRAILSGRQLLQSEPINLRYVSDRSFKQPADYEIRDGYTVFGAVGRAEGRQAWPALVTTDRDGWLASNDVMRLIPREGVRPGAVWMAVAAPGSQTQIKALSFGSVVDHMNPWDVETVIVPSIENRVAEQVEQAWIDLSRSSKLVSDAVALLEGALEAQALR